MNVTIRKFGKSDIKDKIRWINDERNNQYLHYDLPLGYDETVAWFERNHARDDRYDAVIEADGKPVGIIGLLNIDHKNSKAEYYVAIGEHDYKGKGVASRASRQLLKYAFRQLSLNKIYLFTEVSNKPAQRLFEKIGFKREGLLKNDLRVKDEFIDRYLYGLVAKEFDFSAENLHTPLTKTRLKNEEHSLIRKLKKPLSGNVIYIKREDLLPFSFGGNKARKSNLFFQDIQRLCAKSVVTYGTTSSNHCRVVANMAASRGLPCYIISPAENGITTPNSCMFKMLGANVITTPLAKVEETIKKTVQMLKEKGARPYFIEGGGHGNIGTQAYVDAYEEIIEQEKAMNLYFDYIFLPSGTGTTQAGLVCGKYINGHERNIVGISVARKNPYGRQVVLDSVQAYLKSIGFPIKTETDIIFVDDYIHAGYGSYNEEILEVIRRIFISDGIPLDTTYTGKAFWGMGEYLKTHTIEGKNILFLHTGGVPLFFDKLGEYDK